MSYPSRAIQMASAHAYLRFARPHLSSFPPWNVPHDTVDLSEIEQILSEEKLIACMDLLATCGLSESPRGGFWRNMERAAKALNQAERASIYRAHFLAT